MTPAWCHRRRRGTPQGGPMSPLLSNILLDELDRHGHAFCRYADDANVYVGSKRAGERVMQTLERFGPSDCGCVSTATRARWIDPGSGISWGTR